MTMLTDVSSAYVTTTGTMYTGRTRVRGFQVVGTGTVVLRDGGSDGTTKITIPSAGSSGMVIPANGVLFSTDIHATVTGVTGFTIFYG